MQHEDAEGGKAAEDCAIVIVHSRAHAIAAAEAAVDADVALLLRSAPGAAANAGVGWFLAVVRQARETVPEADMAASIDVGNDVALGLECLHAGSPRVRFAGDPSARTVLEDVASRLGASLDDAPGEALDLRFRRHPVEACRQHFLARRARASDR